MKNTPPFLTRWLIFALGGAKTERNNTQALINTMGIVCKACPNIRVRQ